MMALQILPILQVIIILCSPSSSLSYPVYGTKRYGRGIMQRAPSWAPYQPMVRTQRYPMNYYEFYPYSQNYADDYYYPQESLTYPIYYAPARTSKYEVYQAVLPYYYGDRPVIRPNYGYYGSVDNDPIVDLQEEMLQEAEREEREESQPIGQEMLYENEASNNNNNDDSLDEVNAAFLQNLIMSQMYKDAIDNQKKYRGHYPYDDYYNNDYGSNNEKWDDVVDEPKQNYYQEDEDVRELKQLAKPRKENWYERKYDTPRNKQIKSNSFSKYDDKRNANKKTEGVKDALAFSDRKSIVKETTSTTPAPATTKAPKRGSRGQKEEILLRPATPVRYPFSAPVLDMLTKNDEERKRTPSVYDTIKHMLDMEKKLENKYGGSGEIRPNMRKRIISSDESLTRQLSVLKKMSQ